MIELHKTTNIDLDAARKNYETVWRPTELLTPATVSMPGYWYKKSHF